MADVTDQVSVSIGADAGDLETATEASIAAMEALTEAILGLTATQGEQNAASEEQATGLRAIAEAAIEAKNAFVEAKQSIAEMGETLLGAFAVEQVNGFIEKQAELAERSKQTAETLGMQQSEWQGWQTVAQLTGRDAESLATGFERLYRNAVMGSGGSKLQAVAFKDLGISAKEALTPSKLLFDVADKFAQMGDAPGEAARKMADAMALMGRGGARMIPILSEGSAALKEMMGVGQQFGTVMSADLNAKMVELAETQNKLKVAWEGMWANLIAQNAPAIEKIVEDIISLVESFRRWASEGDNLKNMIMVLTGLLVGMAGVMAAGVLGMAIEGLIGLFQGMLVAIDAVIPEVLELDAAMDANPIGAIVLAIEGLIAGLILLYQWLDKIGAMPNIIRALGDAWQLVAGAVQTLIDVFQPLNTAIENYKEAQGEILGQGIVTYFNSVANEAKGIVEWYGKLLDQVYSTIGSGIADYVKDWAERTLGLQINYTKLNTAVEDGVSKVGDFLKTNFPGIVKQWDDWVNTLKGDIEKLSEAWADFTGAVTGKTANMGGAMGVGAGGGFFGAKASGGGGGSNLPDFSTHKNGGGKSHMQELENELREQEEAIRSSTGAWLEDMNQMEADFWESVLANTSTKSKEYQEIKSRAEQASLAVKQDGARQELDADKTAASDQKKSWTEQLAAQAKWLLDTMTLYGNQGPQIAAVNKEIEKLQEEHAKKMADIAMKQAEEQSKAAEDSAKTQYQILQIGFSEQQSVQQMMSTLGVASGQQAYNAKIALLDQETKAEQDEADKEFDIQKKLLTDKIAIQQALGAQGKSQVAELNAQLEALEATHADKMVLIGQQGAQKLYEAWVAEQTRQLNAMKANIDQMVTAFGSGIQKMINGTGTFRQALLGVGNAIESIIVKAVETWIERWIMGEIMRVRATQTANLQIVMANMTGAQQSVALNAMANLKRIQSDAAAAAGAAYKAMAGIPPAPMWGVLAGAAAYAGVMAFEGLASASGGYDIPAGVNPMVQAHEKEMILPGSIADGFRTLFKGFNGPQGGGIPQVGSGGDTHNWNVSAMDGQSFYRFLRRNSDQMSKVIGESIRGGAAQKYAWGLGRS